MGWRDTKSSKTGSEAMVRARLQLFRVCPENVTLGEEDSKSVCVLSGVDAGDILALEKAN